MNYIVAVSGGVDSVALLDMLSKSDHRLIVAHVDHGIRPESAADARFVEALAKKYALPYQAIELKLGPEASEEKAREARYDFLYQLAHTHSASIVTAHHQDDMVGSIAINLTRGTGWRGLAVLNRANLTRPLLAMTKSKLYDYALKNQLEWVEDESNHNPRYLRNRLRAGVLAVDTVSARQVVELRQRQLQLAKEIDRETARVEQRFTNRREPYMLVDSVVGVEVLRLHIERQANYRPSIEQAERLLLAIKTAKPNTSVDIALGIAVQFSKETFVVDTSR